MSLCHRSPLLRLPSTVRLVALIGAALFANTAVGQEYQDFSRLGTSNAVFKPGPQDGDELKRMFRENRADYEKVLNDANWPGDHDDLFNAVESGSFSEAQYPVGHTFEWMAVRKNGIVQPTGRLRWAGSDPFEAFEIRFESRGQEHRFLIPKACGNLSLIEMRTVGPPPITGLAGPRVNVQSPNSCTGANVTVDVSTPGGMPEGASLELTLTRPSGQRETLSPSRAGASYRWEGKLDDAAPIRSALPCYAFRKDAHDDGAVESRAVPAHMQFAAHAAADGSDTKAGRASFGIDMCSSAARVGSLTSKSVKIYHTPLDGSEQLIDTMSLDAECSSSFLMAEYGRYRLEGEVVDDRSMTATCQADYNFAKPEAKLDPFFTLFVGNERRWRPGIEDAPTEGESDLHDRSAVLVGGTFGVAYPIADGAAQVFGQGGVAINLRDSENTSVFADIGIDKLFEAGFIGAGVGIWDFNHSYTVDGSLFVHGGWNVTEKAQFFIEGRLFMSMLDMIDNNYLYMGGIRYFFKR